MQHDIDRSLLPMKRRNLRKLYDSMYESEHTHQIKVVSNSCRSCVALCFQHEAADNKGKWHNAEHPVHLLHFVLPPAQI